ncbi:hypothetical protein GTW40_12390 [Streptomyces sp. SID4985]|nr:hypothetical protein [Streptomyces sp. SID4985]
MIEDVRALLVHGLAVRALRAAGVTDIGIANSHGPAWPTSEEPEDLEARNRWWTSTSGTAVIWIKDLTRTSN